MSEPGKVQLEVDIEVPSMPNFVRVHALGSQGTLDVGQLNDEAVERLIENWATAFRAHVARRRADAFQW